MSIANTHNAIIKICRKKTVRRGFLMLITAFTMSITTTIARADTGPELLDADSWPTTVEGAVDDLLPRIHLSEKLKIQQTRTENTISLYFELGAQIRNRYGLWRGNDKLILSACGFQCHPDDAAMKIIDAAWRYLQKRD